MITFNVARNQPVVDRNYFPAIDGLRAIAVLMVLVFHFDLLPGGYGGFTGVDVFFVISGYLITSIIKRQLDTGSFKIGAFYMSRIRRLAPALFVTLALTLAAGLFLLFPSDLVTLSMQLIAAQTYSANFYYWKSINYFGLASHSAILLHTWSLAVEEQFYLFYPLFLILIHKHLRAFFWQILIVCLAVSFGLNVGLVAAKPEATFYLLPTRAWELLLGALVAGLHTRINISRTASQIAGVIGISLIAFGFFGYQKGFYFPGYFALFPTCGAALTILSITAKPTQFSAIGGNPVVTYVGKISYPLYLVHWPLNIFAAQLMGTAYDTAARCAAFALSIALAATIFHIVEEPIRSARLLTSRRSLRVTYLAGLLTTLVVCTGIYGTRGVPARFAPEAVRLAEFANDKTGDLQCQFGIQKVEDASFCQIGDRKSAPTWLIYGDSHAWATYAAFDKWLNDRKQSGLFIFRQACPPIEGVHLLHDSKCFAFNNKVLAFLDSSPTITDVMLVSTWIQAKEGVLSTSEDVALTQNASIELFRKQFSATMSHLSNRGKRVVIWEPLPGAKTSVPLALAAAYPRTADNSLEFTKQQYETTFDFFFEALKESRALISGTVSPSKALCGTGFCAVTIDGRPIYFDNSHPAASTSDYWAEILRKSVL